MFLLSNWAILIGKPVEFISLMIGYGLGWLFWHPKYHATTYWKCTGLTMAIFGTAAILAPSNTISYVGSFYLGLGIAWYIKRKLGNK